MKPPRTRLVLLAAALLLPTLGATVVSQGVAAAAGPDPAGTIYVSDGATHGIDVFPAGSNGNVAPSRTISGPLTGMGAGGEGPDDVKVDSHGDVWASNFRSDSITEYAPGASGNVAPICDISGSNTGLVSNDDISLAPDGTIYVGNFGGNPVEVFAPGACGNVAPERVIAGSATGLNNIVDGLGVDATGTLYVDNTLNGSIAVFAPGASGNVAPEYTISGSNTGLGRPDDIVVGFSGELFVTNGFGGSVNSVEVFAPGTSGNVAPVQNITGSNTTFGNPDDLGVDSSGNIFVTDTGSSAGLAVLEFASGATGNVAPTATIAGSSTTFVEPEGVAVAGPPATVSATLSTKASASSIPLGGSVNDTATLSGGTSPTGHIEFKLFGPSDPTCIAAPAYTSPFSTVSGDGNYPSPSFTPTAAGTYSWVALYSGDSNNAALSTACGDPNETVSVGQKTCFDGAWPSQVIGYPVISGAGKPPPGAFIGEVASQWKLYTHNLKGTDIFTGTIITNGTFTNITTMSNESDDVVDVYKNHIITFLFHTGRFHDGVQFTTTCGSQVSFKVQEDGTLLPPGNVFLGNPTTTASSNPVTFTRSS